MDTSVTTNTKQALLALTLCEQGSLREATAIIEECEPGPLTLLVRGALLGEVKDERAKDLLSEAVRGLEGELAVKASIRLGCAYWATGEKAEAQTILATIVPVSDETRFLRYLLASVIESESPGYAMSLLVEIQPLLDVVYPLWRGKFYNQRGILFRKLGQIDEALIAYEGARIWFEQVEDKHYLANTTNNIASLFVDAERYQDAHDSVDRATAFLESAGDKSCLGYNYDQKAVVLLAEGEHLDEAVKFAGKAIELLTQTDAKDWLAKSLLTYARVLIEQGKVSVAFQQIEKVNEIVAYLQSPSLALETAKAVKKITESVLRHAERSLVLLALQQAGGSYRKAALKLKITHSGLIKSIVRLGLKRKPQRPRSIISKPSK